MPFMTMLVSKAVTKATMMVPPTGLAAIHCLNLSMSLPA